MPGNYRIMNMRSGGPYSVKISMLGFQTVLNEGINIALSTVWKPSIEIFTE